MNNVKISGSPVAQQVVPGSGGVSDAAPNPHRRSIIFNNTNSSPATCGLRTSAETPVSNGSIPHNFTLAANGTLIIENYIGKATAASGVKIIELL